MGTLDWVVVLCVCWVLVAEIAWPWAVMIFTLGRMTARLNPWLRRPRLAGSPASPPLPYQSVRNRR